MKHLLLPLLCLFSFQAFSQAPTWAWAKGTGTGNKDVGSAIAVDGKGNSYVTGYYTASSITFDTTTLTNAGTTDVFIAKYDSSGNVLWAKSAGGNNLEEGRAIAVDASGNCYVTGYFESSSITFGSTILTNVNGIDIFIVKFDASGNVIWAKNVGGLGLVFGIAVDGNGNCYATGCFFSASISFGSTKLFNTGPNGSADIFIAKFDSSGNAVWAKSAGGNEDDVCTAISVDGRGNSNITGTFKSSSITFGSSMLTNIGGFCSGFPVTSCSDFLIAKFDANGNALWAKSAGGSSHDGGYGIAVDSNSNVYVTGYFAGLSITFDTTKLTNAGPFGSADVFTVKCDSNGNTIWAKNVGCGGDSRGIAVDGMGNSYVVGDFNSPCTFGTTTLNPGIFGDLFILKYDSSGNPVWGKSAGGDGSDRGQGIAVDGGGNCYITGCYDGSYISFGSTTLGSAGDNDFFVARLGNPITGIEDVAKKAELSIAPNPVKDILYLRSNNNKPLSGMAQIYDYTGRKVLEKTIDGKQAEINMQHLPPGLYWLKLGEEAMKIVKE